MLDGLWIKYKCGSELNEKMAQPDFLIFNPFEGIIYLIEVKLTHTTEAYHQMNNKYLPLLEYMFPKWKIARVEIYKNLSGFRWPDLTKAIDNLECIKHPGNYMWRLDI